MTLKQSTHNYVFLYNLQIISAVKKRNIIRNLKRNVMATFK